jgi:hypothetical protein
MVWNQPFCEAVLNLIILVRQYLFCDESWIQIDFNGGRAGTELCEIGDSCARLGTEPKRTVLRRPFFWSESRHSIERSPPIERRVGGFVLLPRV